MVLENRLSWMIGGPQGSGVDSSARMFALACANGGLYVFGKREYYSNIKGEHSYFQIRADKDEIRSPLRTVELLGTFEPETLARHLFSDEVVPGGAVIFDPGDLDTPIHKIGTIEYTLRQKMITEVEAKGLPPTVGSLLDDEHVRGVKLFELPYQKLLEQVGEAVGVKEFAKLQIVKNTVCVGASFGALGYDLDVVLATVDEIFAHKSERVRAMNRTAIELGYNHIHDTYGPIDFRLRKIPREKGARKKHFLAGTAASAMGKIAAGCRMQTYYPITPATDESEFLESHPDGRVVVMQCEDEISAITMAIGAALTGARSSTSTSGPGFNLMVEAFGWAGINEVPMVLVNYQRGGPSTGLPTRHEQGDLKFALNAGHGDLPRILVAPGDLEESFWMMVDAFNWADQYQIPVVYLGDKNLANNSALVDTFEWEKARIDRGRLLTDQEVVEHRKTNGDEHYFLRFQDAADGISPRAVLGQENAVHWLTGDEHDQRGHISEDPENRILQMVKRMHKEEVALEQIPDDKKAILFGPEDAELTLVSWGSNKGAILDALAALAEQGKRVNFLHIKLLSPFPVELVSGILNKAKATALVEMNFVGQLGLLIRQQTGIDLEHRILKYQGRPITQDEVVDAVNKILESGQDKRMLEVLTHGV